MLTIAALVFLSAAAHASAQTGFKNPDGRPNAIAIEPLFEYEAGGPFDVEVLELGLGFTLPVSERVTVRWAGTFGSGDYYTTRASLAESSGRTWVVNDLERREYEQIGLRLSVKIWLGGGKE